MRRILLTSLVLGCILTLWGGVGLAHAETTTTPEIEDLQNQIQTRKDTIAELEKTIASYQTQINQKQTEGQSLRNTLGILDDQNKLLATQIDVTTAKIEAAGLEIRSLEDSIDQKQSAIERQKKIIAKLVLLLNSDSRRQTIEVLLSENNLAKFYTGLATLESVYADLGRATKSLTLAKNELDTQKTQLVSVQKHFADLKEDLLGKQQNLKNQVAYKQTLLSQTQAKESEYRTLVASLKKQYQIVETEQRTYEDKLRAKLSAENKLSSSGALTLSWPVPSHVINALFHDPSYPFRNVFAHTGIDIKAGYGTSVRAAGSGYVARAKRCTNASCYAYVMIIHSSSISTVYGHLSEIDVTEDQFVNRGDIIGMSGGIPGTVGAGPFVTGPHLHFEVRSNGIPIDPLGYLIQ